MFTRKSSFVLFLVTLTVVQLACNAATNSRATPDTFATLNELYTASALTLAAGVTQPAYTSTPGLPLPTYSPGPPPTSLPIPTATNPPVFTQPVPTARCDAAEFVKDVTYPDGSPVPRNTTFEKTWRIRNIGTCTWTTDYSLIFDSGHRMGGPSSKPLSKSVSPGGTIDISVTLTAPAKEGYYLGYWKLQNANGVNFGIGDNANKAFWVEIKVPEASYLVYSFVANYCDAEWNNGGKSLPCPGANGDTNGFVLQLNNPAMENGVIEDDPGLLMAPPDVRNGVISGEYPAFTVQDGDRFRTIVGCQRGSRRCDVMFQLDYKNNGKVRTLFSWNEVYEGEVYPVDFDLSALAGETVKFILIVGAHGGQNQDNAIWLHPFILRQGSKPSPIPPTRTFTPTLTLVPTWTFTPTITLTPTTTATATPTSTPAP